ncbi:MAG TPA: aspartate aminotransferase family protein [Streptosporangiales bacterium]
MSEIRLPAAGAGLLDGRSADRYRRVLEAGVARVAERVAATGRPATGVSPAELEPLVAGVDLDRPLGDVDEALDELSRVYLRDAVYFHHPRYLAHLNCPVAIPALLAEVLVSAVNSSLDTWDQSVGATLVERRLVRWTATRLGLGEAADGVFTSGGTQSNLQALFLAREEARCRTGAPVERLRVLTSAAAHFSVVTSAGLLGLPADAVVAVPCDAARTMRVDALAAELAGCRAAGLVPMAVVATAGTTDFGSIDPLAAIAAVCARDGVWLHVDAAYGCGLLVSRRRELLDGVELADSVTVDYHKSFFQPVSCSAVLVRDAAVLRHTTHHADYLNPASSVAKRIPNQVDKSLQTTRRFDALKLWLTLRVLGADAIGELFDEVLDRAEQAWALLRDDARFDVVMRPRLSTLVFRYRPDHDVSDELCDRANEHAREELFASGEAVIAATRVDGRYHLKFTLLNPRTSVRDIAEVLDLVAGHAERFLYRPETSASVPVRADRSGGTA